MRDTQGEEYARRLQDHEQVWWKRALDVQRPYRWNLRRYDLGRTLDVGCGLGRNLVSLSRDSVGVDHNEHSVQVARARGFHALTTAKWETAEENQPAAYDAMLLAHVIEHLSPEDGEAVVRMYLPNIRPGGKVLFICPQERGYASDPTHIRWTTNDDLADLARALGLEPEVQRSFPFRARRVGSSPTTSSTCSRGCPAELGLLPGVGSHASRRNASTFSSIHEPSGATRIS